MRTLYPLKRWLTLPTGILIAALSTTIALGWLAPSGRTALVDTATLRSSTTQRSVDSVSVFSVTAALQNMPQSVDTYEPPDNGGPGKTGGSGTR